ncbi:MAG: exonuclease domain-containing protein [Fusicatenibacter sp.]|nr:exonuclease domain-containing protein [Fusicatenibacter sp.]
MNYVVFDLEWNQCPYGKEQENPALPFEIIEIGAVKLDSARQIVDTFHRLIRPVVYKHLHHRTREVVGITEEELKGGVPFSQGLREFLNFAGGECMFCTWGPGDLTELQRNMKYYGLLSLLRGPIHFYDVQKLFAIQYETMKSRRALEYAADYLSLSKEDSFHQALSDARYTARIFQTLDMDVVLAYDSIDVYQNPRSKRDEIHAVYNGYTKFISREFDTREEAIRDREVSSTHCCICGRTARKKMRWFSAGGKNYYCVAYCPEHGYLKGKARMKHTDEGKTFVVKTIRVSCEEEAGEIRQKKENLRKKRLQKKNS